MGGPQTQPEVPYMTEFVDTTVKQIDGRLRELTREVASLERARAALTNGTGGPARAGRAASGANGRRRTTAPRARRAGGTRADQALELIHSRPGITIPELAQAMKIQPNYLYRVLPRLASDGQVSRQDTGWHPGSSSSTTGAAAKPRSSNRGRTTSSSSRRSRRRGERNGRPSRASSGNTTSSVLAALTAGEAMTASEVAAKAGLARPTVSTTLSKLAKSGRVEKAARGYRLAAAA